MRLQEEARITELQRELERIEKEDEEPSPRANIKARRPSRFAISSVDDANLGPTEASLLTPSWGSRKLKGILKKNEDSSHTVHGAPDTGASSFASPYTTVTGTG